MFCNAITHLKKKKKKPCDVLCFTADRRVRRKLGARCDDVMLHANYR